MMKFALLGHHISYSMSPVIHDMISTTDIHYEIIDLAPEQLLKERPQQLQALNGFNITIPHKQSILSFCDHVDPVAEKIGAINTVEIVDGIWTGYNTDYLGFIRSLKDSLKNYFDFHPVLVGYGGVARAVIFALQEMGFRSITVIGGVDDVERQDFIQEMNLNAKIKILDFLPELPTLWINGTPVGGAKIKDIPEDYIPFNANDVLFDLNYTPYPTHLELYAQNKGLKTINGMKMLVYQAVEAQKIWFKSHEIKDLNVNEIIRRLVTLNTIS